MVNNILQINPGFLGDNQSLAGSRKSVNLQVLWHDDQHFDDDVDLFDDDDDNLGDMTVVAGNTLYWDNSGLLVVGPWLVMLVNFIWRDGGTDEAEEPPPS